MARKEPILELGLPYLIHNLYQIFHVSKNGTQCIKVETDIIEVGAYISFKTLRSISKKIEEISFVLIIENSSSEIYNFS